MTTKRGFQAPEAAAVVVLLLFILCGLCRPSLGGVFVDNLKLGYSTSPLHSVDTNGVFLQSLNQSFQLGFTPGTSTTYYLCVQHIVSSTIVWCANRDDPIQRSDSFVFGSGGSVVLQGPGGATVWTTATSGGSRLQLHQSGNLILFNEKNDVLWQSFDHPTDTILSGQKFGPELRLISSKTVSDRSQGDYYMSVDASGLALYSNVSSPQAYWTLADDGKSHQLAAGVPAYATLASNSLETVAADGVTVVSQIVLDNFDGSTIRRATLEADGNLRVYILSGSAQNVAFQAVREECGLPGACGAYGLCMGNGQCSCPPSYSALNSTDPSQGCVPSYVPGCSPSNSTASPLELVDLGNVDYYANRHAEPQGPADLAACKAACRGNCSCSGLFWHNDTLSCFVWDGELGTMAVDGDGNHRAFLKAARRPAAPPASKKRSTAVYEIVGILVGAGILIAGLFAGAWWLHKRRLAQHSAEDDDDQVPDSIPGLPTRFSYRELEEATFGFRDRLGAGGFGAVYEGLLPGNTRVAVKRLEGVGQGKKEFWAEVATIGSIHHVHLVQLRGFCAEGAHRLLVYEFCANGSLAKVLFSTTKDGVVLDWETRCKISVATARGLSYLHDDCRERIIHCDIKPENILLDEHFVAKVSDFGLAKLMNREHSEVITQLRGTRGYLAPEWLISSSISDKSDVYSFGMVLLEIISGRKNYDPTESAEKWYFPMYAFQQAEVGNANLLADPKLNGMADEDQVATLTHIALWCIQDEVALRPSMKKVVKMIEGIIDVPKPPQSPQLAARLQGRKWDSGNDSTMSDFYNSEALSASRLSGPR